MSILTKRNITIGAIVVGIPALLIAWWLISPLFFDKVVDEEFPMSAGAVVPDDMTQHVSGRRRLPSGIRHCNRL